MSKPSLSHLSITQAGITALFVTIVGLLIAIIPAFGPAKEAIIAVGTIVIAASFLIANALHANAASRLNTHDVAAAATSAARTELGKADLGSMVKRAVDAIVVTSTSEANRGAVEAARTEIQNVNFDALVKAAVDDAKIVPDLDGKIHTQVQRIMSELLGQAASQHATKPVGGSEPEPAVSTDDQPPGQVTSP